MSIPMDFIVMEMTRIVTMDIPLRVHAILTMMMAVVWVWLWTSNVKMIFFLHHLHILLWAHKDPHAKEIKWYINLCRQANSAVVFACFAMKWYTHLLYGTWVHIRIKYMRKIKGGMNNNKKSIDDVIWKMIYSETNHTLVNNAWGLGAGVDCKGIYVRN